MKFLFCFLITISALSLSAQNPVAQVAIIGKGSPILFIPHIGCPPALWEEVVSELSKNNECHVVALAGFADMVPIDSAYTKRYLDYLQRYIQTKKLKNVTLVGMNYGGFLALQLAQQTGVQKLVIVDTFPFLAQVLNPKATLEDAKLYAAQMKTGYQTPNEKDFEAMLYQNGIAMITNDSVKAKTYAQWVTRSDRKTIANAIADQMASDLRPLLPAIKIPVLIISTWYFGKTYKQQPIEEGYRMHEEFFATLPNHTVKLTETAKDFMHWDEPVWFLNELNTFLTK